jgi:sialate O-acetylesterase
MDNALKPGEENVLAVRVYDGYLNGGIYEGPIGIITQDKYRKFWKDRSKKNIWDLIFGN